MPFIVVVGTQTAGVFGRLARRAWDLGRPTLLREHLGHLRQLEHLELLESLELFGRYIPDEEEDSPPIRRLVETETSTRSAAKSLVILVTSTRVCMNNMY